MHMPKEMKIKERKTNKEESQSKKYNKKNNKLNQNKKGITLVALVVTMIVLIILAGVVIATLTGDNGIITKANEAKEQQEEAEELEKLKLAVNAAYTKSQGENRELTTSDIEEELEKNNLNGTLTENATWKYVGNKHTYTIKNNGEIKICNGTIIYGNNVNILPEGYTQIEYIESTKTQYIDTGFIPSSETKFYISLESTCETTSIDGTILVSKWSTDGFALTNRYGVLTWHNENAYSICNIKKGDLYNIEIYQNTAYVNEEQKLKIAYSKKNYNETIKLFGLADGSHMNSYKLYKLKLWDNDIYREYIPCYQKSTENIGLYEIKTDTFILGQGSNKLVKGKEINELKFVGDKDENNKFKIPITLETTEGEKNITITLNEPLRKLEDKVDYLDLENKKVVRYIQQDATTGELSILENSTEESIEMETINFDTVNSVTVNTEIAPSIIE